MQAVASSEKFRRRSSSRKNQQVVTLQFPQIEKAATNQNGQHQHHQHNFLWQENNYDVDKAAALPNPRLHGTR